MRNLKADLWKSEVSSISSSSDLNGSNDFTLGFLLWRELLSQMVTALLTLTGASWGEMCLSCEALKHCGSGNHGNTIDRAWSLHTSVSCCLLQRGECLLSLRDACLRGSAALCFQQGSVAPRLGTVWVSLGQTSGKVFRFVMHQGPGEWLSDWHLYRLLYSRSFLGGWQSGCKFPRAQTSVWLRSGH